MLSFFLACAAGASGALSDRAPASSDWITTGPDCDLFACGDVDGDGFGDVLTINGAQQLCVAYTVGGWKASPWTVVLEPAPEGAVDLLVRHADEGGIEVLVMCVDAWHAYRLAQGKLVEHPGLATRSAKQTETVALTVSPPPYEESVEGLQPRRTFRGDLNGDGRMDVLAVFAATRPSAHRVVRVAFTPNPEGDMDDDGLTDLAERVLGTDPLDRDTDDDGLLDGWEVNGLPRGVEGPEGGLDPRHQDVIVWLSPFEPLTEDAVRQELARSKRLYAEIDSKNPDGSSGIHLRYRFGPIVPKDKQGNWPEVGNANLPEACRGLMHWMQVTTGGGGQAQQTGDMGGAGNHWAAFAHELGHQLSLSHTGDSAPAWCPFYGSLMNYAFGYSFDGNSEKIHFSSGGLRALELKETALDECLAVGTDSVRYLAGPPFHFTVQPIDAAHTWIDWNHDGLRDTSPVSADVNYGGSTYGGTRRDVGFSGAGPAMARALGSIWLATVNSEHTEVSVRSYLGNEAWSAPRVIPNSQTTTEPVLVGTPEALFVFVRGTVNWGVMRVDAQRVLEPLVLRDLAMDDLSACLVGDRILLASRALDGKIKTRWFVLSASEDGSPRALLASGPELDVTSDVPISITRDTKSNVFAVASAGKNPGGVEKCLKIARFELTPDGKFAKLGERWVGGEKGNVNCTSRPVVRFTDAGKMFVFHSGLPDENGTWTAYRSQEVANKSLSDGWLVCLMYDVWTRSKVPVAFELDGDTAIYSYRWDASADRMNMLQTAHEGLGIDREPMRDFDDGAQISSWGIRHSILTMRR